MVSGNTCSWPRWWLTWGGAGEVASEGRGDTPALVLGKSQLALGRLQSPKGRVGRDPGCCHLEPCRSPCSAPQGHTGGPCCSPSREIQKSDLPRDQGACSGPDRLPSCLPPAFCHLAPKQSTKGGTHPGPSVSHTQKLPSAPTYIPGSGQGWLPGSPSLTPGDNTLVLQNTGSAVCGPAAHPPSAWPKAGALVSATGIGASAPWQQRAREAA